MNILERYLAKALLKGVALSWAVLVLLLSLVALVRELEDVGRGQYALSDAFVVVGLTLPERALDVVTVSALVGGILGLGGLAAGHELSVLRAAGFPPRRFFWVALKTALPLVILVLALTEWSAPPLSQAAARTKRIASEGPSATITKKAVWLRETGTIVRIGRIQDDRTLLDVEVFRFSEDSSLKEVLHAGSATLRAAGWVLLDVREDPVSTVSTAVTTHHAELEFPLLAKNLDLLTSPPNLFSLSRLLSERKKASDPSMRDEFWRIFWRKVANALLVATMLGLSVPFALRGGGIRSANQRLALGAVVGVFAHLGVQAVSYLGALAELDATAVALAPVSATLLATWAFMPDS